MNATQVAPRSDWTKSEVRELFEKPLLDLVFQAASIHREHHDPNEVQRCTLLSIKTGACPEDCSYCPQSASNQAEVETEDLLDVRTVLDEAKAAREEGATRFCMGAAWRDAPEDERFERVLEMVRGVRSMGMEACVTLGMLTSEQTEQLHEAGLTAYNHNLDTSEEFYPNIISTRSYQDRLDTLQNVREHGIHVCSGGIVGMGEGRSDRAAMLRTLASFDPHPESVPVNLLERVEGTPLADADDTDPFEVVRTVAAARILMPRSRVRLSAGRRSLTREAQAMCFMAGANSIFFGERLLTSGNPAIEADESLFSDLGIVTG